MEAKLKRLKGSRTTARGNVTKTQKKLREMLALPTDELSPTVISTFLHGIDKQFATHRNTFESMMEVLELDGDDLDEEQAEQYREHDNELQANISELEELQTAFTQLSMRAQACIELESLDTLIGLVVIQPDGNRRKAARTVSGHQDELKQATKDYGGVLRTDEHLKGLVRKIGTKLNDLSSQVPEEELPPTIPARSRRRSRSRSASRDRYHGRRGLPKLDIPVFTGNIHDFPYWWKQFNKFVHQDEKFDESDKLTYLKQCFQSPSDMVILDNQGAGPGLYAAYIKEIQQTYDRPRLVHRHYTKEVLSVQPMTNNSVEQIKLLYSTVNNAVLKLEATKQYNIDSVLTSHVELLMTPALRGKWKEHTSSQRDVPPIKELLAFLMERKHNQDEIEAFDKKPYVGRQDRRRDASGEQPHKKERYDQPYKKGRNKGNYQQSATVKKEVYTTTRTWPDCKLCKTGSHAMYLCPTFLEYSLKQRADYVLREKLCGNCLGASHDTASCRNSYRCRECGKKHNTTLHPEDSTTHTVYLTESSAKQGTATIFPTMELLVHSPTGSQAEVTALFDTGAKISLVTEDVVHQLGLPQQKTNVQVVGVNGDYSNRRTATTVALTVTSSHQTGSELQVKAFVVPEIGSKQVGDTNRISEGNWMMLEGLKLANPNFHRPGSLELLLGNDVLERVELLEAKKGGGLIARKTIFGWVVNGQQTEEQETHNINHYVCAVTGKQVTSDLLEVQQRTDERIREFFYSEELPELQTQTAEDEEALHHYEETHRILPSGRFQVSLPKSKGHPPLGFSKTQAIRRYMTNERSLQRKGGFERFQQVVAEYLELGHAQLVSREDLLKPTECVYYLPMHAVYKDSTTSPLRVVFDASAATSTGVSLNDTLLTGPTVYPSLTEILIRFRQHNVALTADISKMFRCIVLDPEDRSLHRFIWRRQPNEPLLDYQMNRVTFGVSSSPFLATQTLQQVATNVSTTHPLAAQALKRAFYVDDFISGTTTREEASILQTELQQVLEVHGFKLRKWRSSSQEVLGVIPDDQQEKEPTQKPYGPHDHLKTLGIHWDAKEDVFRISTSKLQYTDKVTKRTLASDVAQTYDILGWFSPATIQMKLIIQELWKTNHDWDDAANETIQQQWLNWKSELPQLAARPIPRQYFHRDQRPTEIQLHGFSDASLKGYAAVVYLRAVYTAAPPTIRLVTAKTKVANVKGSTVPRLELCGAKLLAELIVSVMDALAMQPTQLHCWTDSQVVLYWLDGRRRNNKIYVANRVARTLELVATDRWRHVPGIDNPADCASRGVSPQTLRDHPLWWHGPSWLAKEPFQCPPQPALTHLEKETHVIIETVGLVEQQESLWNLGRSSTYNKTRRVLAWSRRFLNNVRAKRLNQEKHSEPELTKDEIQDAETVLYIQAQERMVSGKHPERWTTDKLTRSLNPKRDTLGIYRVDGRLHNSPLEYAARHPIILKGTDPLTRQIIRHHHYETLHGGPSQVLTSLSRQFYIIHGMAIVKATCRKCVVCIRFNAKREKQLMGQLPRYRVTPGKVFDVVGTDFAGPITVNQGNPRKPRRLKAYICVLVCMSTKAVHLEAVLGLSTDDFLACLRRFIARRGKPSRIMSDNGTNFVGAAKEIDTIFHLLQEEEARKRITRFCANDNIQWVFNPARAPHFGGIWEATVKSVKHHLRRIEYKRTFSYEELNTTLCQIEAILNSRPLMAIHAQSTEGLEVLTAGHFLIGRPLIALPEKELSLTSNLAKRWDSCQQATQRFWREWSDDYLKLFHKRSKWQKPAKNVEIGDIVLLREDTAFQKNDWPLARVTQVYPGKDGFVRAVDVRHGKSTWRRPIAKLTVLLPVTLDDTLTDGEQQATLISPGGGCLSSGQSTSDRKKVSFMSEFNNSD